MEIISWFLRSLCISAASMFCHIGITFLSILSFVIHSHCDEIDDNRASYRYLSELQSEYFTKLPKWWLTVSEIGDGARPIDDFIQTVVNEHREYVFKPSREQLKLNYYRTYLLLDIENFNETISVIFNTLKEDSDYLYDENVATGNHFSVAQLTKWAESEKTKNLKANLQTLYDISLQPDVVFRHIQRVCIVENRRIYIIIYFYICTY